ncbi:MAG: pyrroline-5-carboxylate reductase [Helicobacteraceae bacterium]|nr:pyrroline-5-carboxylate reductase [Helicobacteraceae bacterium]
MPNNNNTITFIGNGNMALSLALGLKDSFNIEVVGRSNEKLDNFEKKLGKSIKKSLLKGFNIEGKNIFLCVKPANTQEVGKLLGGQASTLYSVLAGTSLETLSLHFDAHSYVRAMPNLAATTLNSMTTLCGDENSKDSAISLFNAIGTTLWVGSEKELDIATALAGSGPAYLSLIAEALTDGAVKQGLKRVDAMTLMRGLFAGFGSVIQDTHPALLKDGVMSPGGTTAAGYSALEDGGVRASCINAIEKAYAVTKK